MNSKKELISWLNDAHTMELTLTEVLTNHANDAKGRPEIRIKLEAHLAETRNHAQQVERCLTLLGEKPSAAKGLMGKAMGMVQGASTGMFSDELVKNALSDYSAEHMEIASYTSLIAAAEEEGLPEIARICEKILKEEQSMADWLEERIPEITTSYLRAQKHAKQ